MKSPIFYPAVTYSSARSAIFSLEYMLLNTMQQLLPEPKPNGKKYEKRVRATSPETLRALRVGIDEILTRDAENIIQGLYPLSVLAPESPLKHLLRLPGIIADGASICLRRRRGRTTEFDTEAKEFLKDVPRYYRRNFHFQTDGYLSRRSAKLYEHQVEMLFGGAADAMRRLILKPLHERFGDTDGHGLTFLEIGAGTGRATRFARLAFPRAKIVAVDLSDPYLRVAERNLSRFARIDFVQSDGAKLPFQDGLFDAAYSVFLYHELPLAARKEIIAESRRVLKAGGFLGLVDALQLGDRKSFEPLLENFPDNYHEPFFRNYLAHPMQALLEGGGLCGVRLDQGFLSKVCWGCVPS